MKKDYLLHTTWNNIPQYIKNIKYLLNSFKPKFKEYLLLNVLDIKTNYILTNEIV